MSNTNNTATRDLVRPAYAARLLQVPVAELVRRIEAASIRPALTIEGRNYFELTTLERIVGVRSNAER